MRQIALAHANFDSRLTSTYSCRMETDASRFAGGVLGAIGGTPMVQLNKIVGTSGARVLLKLESANPTGSMKDRMAVEVIKSAAGDGRLAPNDTVVEYTAGTTGANMTYRRAVSAP